MALSLRTECFPGIIRCRSDQEVDMGFIFFILCAMLSGGVTYHLTHIVLLSIAVGIIAGLTCSIIIVASE